MAGGDDSFSNKSDDSMPVLDTDMGDMRDEPESVRVPKLPSTPGMGVVSQSLNHSRFSS